MRMFKGLMMCAMAGVVIGGMSTGAKAAVLLEYDANSQLIAPAPDSAAGGSWTKGLVGTGASESAGTDTSNYWRMLDENTGGNGDVNYSLNPLSASASAFTDPSGWTATIVIKVISASANNFGTEFDIRNGSNFWSLSWVNDGNSEYVANSSGLVQITTGDFHSDYNTFQIVYDPGTASASLYINGVLTPGLVASNSAANFLRWGSASAAATSDLYVKLVRFETGQNIVPEPASLGLLGVAGLALFAGRRR